MEPDKTITETLGKSSVKEIKEIEKQIPTIIYEKKKQVSFSEFETEYISVSDKTSKEAYKTMKKIKEELMK